VEVEQLKVKEHLLLLDLEDLVAVLVEVNLQVHLQ
jgi:hypothetical protein|tara:strand:- start:128 stop:232 length:105 start_codon:yes stop_codon:yes gene_type:complete